jgi:hypothetical protein
MRTEIVRLSVHAFMLASGTKNFPTADIIVTLYSTETIEVAIDLQGRQMCQGLVLCMEIHLRLATTACVST